MKLFTPVLSLLFVCYISAAQHMGNFQNQVSQHEISRANIAYGNATVGKNKPMNNSPLRPNNQLNIALKALHNIEATDYTAVFNINQIGTTAKETTDLMNKKIESIKQSLREKGFTGQFAVDMISFLPQYEVEVTKKLFSKTYTEVPVGFELQQNLMISYRKDTDFERILTACAQAEVYNLVKVDYYVEDLQGKYLELQNQLLREVEQRKKLFTSLGFDLSTYNIHFDDRKYYHTPKDFYKSYTAPENISMDALRRKVNVVKIKKPTSYYYDAIPYEEYDLVINAAIKKPVIQLGMDMHLIFVPKPKEKKPQPITPKPQPKIYIVSPDGPVDIKQLPEH